VKKIVLILIVLFSIGGAFAQKSANIKHTVSVPEIDGFIEEIWDAMAPQKIDVPFKTETATIGNSTWQGLLDNDNFYCVVYVEDDNHWPAWKAGSSNTWEYDKPEFYWDVNEILKDGVGTRKSNSGHYQLAPGFIDGSYDMAITQPQSAPGNLNPGGTWAYSLIGQGYVYEIAVPWANLTDKNGKPIDMKTLRDKGIGFDITIIDQDKGVTTARQRMNWNNAGAIDECLNNMDEAGIIYEEFVCCDGVNYLSQESVSLGAFPNLISDKVTFSKEIDRVELFNTLGILVKDERIHGKTIMVHDLAKGVYIIKAYKNSQFAGVARIIKN
jgi:hypothetical protein